MDSIEVMLKILIFLDASPRYCITAQSSSLGSQQYFKKMNDRGKDVKIKIQT
jgi:hypothetical protein